MPPEDGYQELDVEEDEINDSELEAASLVESNYAPLTLFNFQPEDFGLGTGVTINEPPSPTADDQGTEERSSTIGTDTLPTRNIFGPLQLQPAPQNT